MAVSQHHRLPDAPQEGLDKTRALPLRAPVIIAVVVDKPVETKVLEVENFAAGFCCLPKDSIGPLMLLVSA